MGELKLKFVATVYFNKNIYKMDGKKGEGRMDYVKDYKTIDMLRYTHPHFPFIHTI